MDDRQDADQWLRSSFFTPRVSHGPISDGIRPSLPLTDHMRLSFLQEQSDLTSRLRPSVLCAPQSGRDSFSDLLGSTWSTMPVPAEQHNRRPSVRQAPPMARPNSFAPRLSAVFSPEAPQSVSLAPLGGYADEASIHTLALAADAAFKKDVPAVLEPAPKRRRLAVRGVVDAEAPDTPSADIPMKTQQPDQQISEPTLSETWATQTWSAYPLMALVGNLKSMSVVWMSELAKSEIGITAEQVASGSVHPKTLYVTKPEDTRNTANSPSFLNERTVIYRRGLLQPVFTVASIISEPTARDPSLVVSGLTPQQHMTAMHHELQSMMWGETAICRKIFNLRTEKCAIVDARLCIKDVNQAMRREFGLSFDSESCSWRQSSTQASISGLSDLLKTPFSVLQLQMLNRVVNSSQASVKTGVELVGVAGRLTLVFTIISDHFLCEFFPENLQAPHGLPVTGSSTLPF
eukprot:TRINITY_DN20509_c0_g1_i1.p1 TRINITY_DN20509_c0_g1~~TRINITY_DN20509_c0_g1_i1.p1  ORF type:complete len:461 (-),score=64.56 TRINITY_DN20509_c0_g1_i1:25-1407(-)